MKKILYFLLFLLLATTLLADDKDFLRELQSLMKDQKYNQAIRLLEENKPKVSPSLKDDIAYYLAYIHYRQGKYTLAKRELTKLTMDFTEEDMADDALLLLGKIQTEKGDYSEGLMTYEKVYRHYQDRETAPEALYLIAEYYLSKGEDNKTIHLLNKISREYPEYAKYKKASELIEKIKERRKKIEEAKKKQEQKQEKKRIEAKPAPPPKPLTDKEKAKRYVERRVYPQGEEKYKIYWLKRIIPEAEKELERTEEPQSKKSLAQYIAKCSFWLAARLKKIGLFDESRRLYASIIEKYPHSSWYPKQSEYEIAITYWEEGNAQRALELLDEYIKKHPDDDYVMPRSQKAEILYEIGRYEESIRAFNKYKDVFPNTPEIDWVHLRISQSYYQLERYEEAKSHLEGFLKKYPGSYFAPGVKRLLAEVNKLLDKQ